MQSILLTFNDVKLSTLYYHLFGKSAMSYITFKFLILFVLVGDGDDGVLVLGRVALDWCYRRSCCRRRLSH